MNVMQNQYIMNINEMNTNNQGFPNPNSAANLNFNEKKPKKRKKVKRKDLKERMKLMFKITLLIFIN